MPIDVVLFDLGGVLFDFVGMAAMREMTGTGAADDDVARRWLASEWVRRFESGGCTAAEFGEGMRTEWGLPLSSEEFLAQFAEWLVAPYEGADELVRDVSAEAVRVGCLSNTNETHWRAKISRCSFTQAFDVTLLSFRMGAVKPDPEAFRHAVRAVDAEPAAILFLDDNLVNVEAAAAVGITAKQARGVAGARLALRDAGVLA